MWHKADLIGHPVRLELPRKDFLVMLAFTSPEVPWIYLVKAHGGLRLFWSIVCAFEDLDIKLLWRCFVKICPIEIKQVIGFHTKKISYCDIKTVYCKNMSIWVNVVLVDSIWHKYLNHNYKMYRIVIIPYYLNNILFLKNCF